MRLLQPRKHATKRRLVSAATVVLLSAGALAGTAQSAPATPENLQAWQAKMAQQAPTGGCFTASYPELVWQQTGCVAAPNTPMSPRVPGFGPQAIGLGDDVVSQVPPGGGPITSATGSFDGDSVRNVTSVQSPLIPGDRPVPNAYTLQLNTNYFSTPLCADSPLCKGWQQFVFANDGTSGKVYIQYWLLPYDKPCPAGWNAVVISNINGCFQNSPAAAVPNMPLTTATMPAYKLTGDISGNDRAVFAGGTTLYTSQGTGALDASVEWNQVEFNALGYGSGTMAEFNDDADFQVRTQINYGGTAAPICVNTGYSAESNNLNFVEPPPFANPPGPAIVFHEKKIGPNDPWSSACGAATAIGDTHERTFAGLLYDFQATGDFVEAQVGSAFEVQTRKASGAPSWPNASINRSIATRMGSTQVAMCDGSRLVVNGTTTTLAPGGVLSLPSGVTVTRTGDVYVVRDQSGNSMRAAPHPGTTNYTDLQVGLGTWPTTVKGLLGNPNNNPNQLAAKDGTQFTIPISFSDLYNRFGASWRVAPIASLLQPCNAVSAGSPSGPFFTGHLDPNLRQQAETTCRNTGITAAWLDTCTLDAAVLGPTAATVYVGKQAPVVNANPKPATHFGMTWAMLEQRPNAIVHVGTDAVTNPYNGDTPPTTALPVLCLHVDGRAAPAGIPTTGFHSWAFGEVRITGSVLGSALTSRAAADQLCTTGFGAGWRMAEFHDGIGWSFWANGTLPSGRFWTAINDQPANPWS